MVREVKQREVERFLESKGWTLLRHGQVSPGVVRQIIKRIPDAPQSWK